ncbi:hypothetical protein CBM2598_U10046 [Cupriavidus taiwanensis]|nr:hypothetical protein CBM2598_U10046 [Cupriavidus taiwanensis]
MGGGVSKGADGDGGAIEARGLPAVETPVAAVAFAVFAGKCAGIAAR